MQLTYFNLNGLTNTGTGDNLVSPKTIGGKSYYPIIPIFDKNGNQRKSVIVRTLQVSNGLGDTIVQIVRSDDTGSNIFFKNKFNLTSYNYLLLWQGFIYIPQGMGLYASVDVQNTEGVDTGVNFYASCILQDNITNSAI